MSPAKTWARRQLVAELLDLERGGRACNTQEWARPGVKKLVEVCKVRRREARRLLAIAIKAVESAP